MNKVKQSVRAVAAAAAGHDTTFDSVRGTPTEEVVEIGTGGTPRFKRRAERPTSTTSPSSLEEEYLEDTTGGSTAPDADDVGIAVENKTKKQRLCQDVQDTAGADQRAMMMMMAAAAAATGQQDLRIKEGGGSNSSRDVQVYSNMLLSKLAAERSANLKTEDDAALLAAATAAVLGRRGTTTAMTATQTNMKLLDSGGGGGSGVGGGMASSHHLAFYNADQQHSHRQAVHRAFLDSLTNRGIHQHPYQHTSPETGPVMLHQQQHHRHSNLSPPSVAHDFTNVDQGASMIAPPPAGWFPGGGVGSGSSSTAFASLLLSHLAATNHPPGAAGQQPPHLLHTRPSAVAPSRRISVNNEDILDIWKHLQAAGSSRGSHL